MKKNLSLAVTFLAEWVVMTLVCYSIGRIFNQGCFMDLSFDIVVGLAFASVNVFGPIAAAIVRRVSRKNRDMA